jgi:hypothetical protein
VNARGRQSRPRETDREIDRADRIEHVRLSIPTFTGEGRERDHHATFAIRLRDRRQARAEGR